MSEFVYYLDRRSDTVITENQVMISGRRLVLSQIREIKIESKHTAAQIKANNTLKVVSVAALAATFGEKLAFGGNSATGLIAVSMLVLALSLIGMILLGAVQPQQQSLVVKQANGASEELVASKDRRRMRELAQALKDAVGDYKTGRNANNRGVTY